MQPLQFHSYSFVIHFLDYASHNNAIKGSTAIFVQSETEKKHTKKEIDSFRFFDSLHALSGGKIVLSFLVNHMHEFLAPSDFRFRFLPML